MTQLKWILISLVLFLTSLLTLGCGPSTELGYREPLLPNPGGIGKVYMGRPIANVMGYEGLYWLERPQRATDEKPAQVIAALDLQPTAVVADIGAGSGYFSFRLGEQVPQGHVFAVDVQPEMVAFMEAYSQDLDATNVEPILGDLQDPHLPDQSIDLALMVDTYHEFAYPREMMTAIVQSLKPEGRVVLVEYKKENPLIPIKTLHKMNKVQAQREMEAVGLQWVEAKTVVPQQHVLIFRKAA